jgi:diguanylate cyclase (GGDEF)-like protein/PAS domain S-box-containing protein
MQQALKESESQFRLLAENASDMISRHTTEGIFIYVSPACKTMIGFSPEELIGKSSLDFIHPEDRSNFKSLFSKNPSMPTVYTFAYQARHKDGQYVWLETSARSILDEKTGSVIEIQAASRDITARKEADEKIRRLNIGLEQLAMTDYLTNLYNRRYFMQRGAEEFKRSRRNNQPLALLMLDIDQFKKVNDTYGHETGDLALQQVAAALKSSLREIDILGRMGGEEFAVLLPNTLLHAAALLAERVQQTMAGTSFEMLGVSSTISITISIGVAAATNEMSGIDDMLRNADAAMYQAKHYGGNRVMQYEDVSGAHQGPSVPASE